MCCQLDRVCPEKVRAFFVFVVQGTSNLSYCQGTEPSGEVKYFAKYSLTAVPVTLPAVPTALTLSRGHSYNVS